MQRFRALILAAASTLLLTPAEASVFCDTMKSIVTSADEDTAFESLNTHELNGDDQMTASITLLGMACAVEPETGKTFFSCEGDATDADAMQTQWAKAVGICFAQAVKTETASMGDIVSSIEIVQKRNVTIAVRWSGSFRKISINTIAAEK